jgi:AraC-like DNA-binding protein
LALILEGEGWIERPNPAEPIHPPAALLGRPGSDYHYGPVAWYEVLYVTFFAEHAAWERCFHRRAGPDLWPLQDPQPFRRMAQELADLVGQERLPGVADKIDHLGHLIMAEAYLQAQRPPDQGIRDRLRRIRAILDRRLDQPVDMAALAQEHGFSSRNLRRRFQEEFGCGPKAYLTHQRLARAGDLLSHTSLPVSEVARRTGFADPLHFSRLFRRHLGVSPTSFRRQHGQGHTDAASGLTTL